MDMAKQAKAFLDEAEHRIRALVSEAAAQGAYDDVMHLTDLARSLCELAQQAGDNGTLVDTPPTAMAAHASAEPVGINRHRRAPAPQPSAGRKRRFNKGDYPRFFRRGDELVKIGWSKKEKSEYQHKAPKRVIDALAAAIARRSGNGRLFTVDDLLPLKDPQDETELPAYQVYVALAWFKINRLVEQHGRSGYSLQNGARLSEAVTSSWNHLPESAV